MNTWLPSAEKAVPRSSQGEKTPGRLPSDDERFQTTNSVLPGRYTQRKTVFVRSDLVLKSGLSSSVAGLKMYERGSASARMFEYAPTATNGCRNICSVRFLVKEYVSRPVTSRTSWSSVP